jgi:methylmalonyl-CoA mutase cobalamin-binding subunit
LSQVIPSVADSTFLKAVEETLRNRVRAALKGPLMTIAEEQVDAAVEEAVKAMDVSIKGYGSMERMRGTVEILLKRAPPAALSPSEEGGGR